MDNKDWDRIAKSFYTEILSPIKNAKKNPLFEDLNNVAHKKKTVIDAGCGLGPLAPYLSERFSKVLGIDFSQEMIERAKIKNKHLPNVQFSREDMTNLTSFHNKFDVVVSINSLLMTKLQQLDDALHQLHSVLKPSGTLLAVLPSMEVYLYQAMLHIEEQRKSGKPQSKALMNTKEFFNDKEHNFLFGSVTFDGDEEKCFYDFEIQHRFSKAGFKNIRISKVLYSWKEFQKAGQHSFEGNPLPWDWYIFAEKSSIN